MPRQPSGTITFLFTDIEASTLLLHRLGDKRYARVLNEHRRLLKAICRREHGREIGQEGDGIFMAFPRARDAVTAAVAAQLAILEHPWPDGAVPRVRMAVHTGEPSVNAGELVGLDLHRAARICGAGHGGQILVSGTAAALVGGNLPARVELRDLGRHRLRDVPEPERLFQVLHPDLRREFPPPRSIDISSNNLPRPATSFVGRTQEIADVKRLLAATKVLTLTGIGGCGKTRLALESVRDLGEAYADGVWFVELAGLQESRLVANTVASALGVIATQGTTLEHTLLEYLRRRTVLLLIDNCEHLITSCAQLVAELTRSCPDLQVLATSREPLGLPGEAVWQVPPLSLPETEQPLTAEGLMRYEATRLFVERAAATGRPLALSDRDAAAVGSICRRLDGIPLAIELAAARVQLLSVGQIAERLDARFSLLTGGSRIATPRQRTLRGALDWSYELLSHKERVLMRRLAVFAGSWTLEAAEAICPGDGLDASDILDTLGQLVSKSLVVANAPGGRTEYRMLETVREYAQERLEEAQEIPGTRARHLQWYLDLAERAEGELSGPAQATWLGTLQPEYDNFRVALEWCKLNESTGDAGLRLAEALWQFWYVRGNFSEGRMWLDTMLSRHRAIDGLRAKALREAGFLAWRQGDYDGAAALGNEGLALFRQLGDLAGMGGAVYLLGNVAFYRGDLERAKKLHLESLALRREVGDKRRIAISLNSLGEVARAEGDYATARSVYQESMVLAKDAGDIRGAATATGNLGYVALFEGDYDRAAKLLKEGLTLARQLVHKLGIAGYFTGLASVAAATGDFVRAARLLGATNGLLTALDVSLTAPDRVQYDRAMLATRSALNDAAFDQGLNHGASMTLDESVAYALEEPRAGMESGERAQ
jgi:predicted ATPase/class 3 adenylate cyclase